MRLRATLLVAALLCTLPVAARAQDDAVRALPEVVTSFDGTRLYTTLFLPPGASEERPVPVVLRGHGWGGKGERSVDPGSTLAKLLDAGYAVLTWDQRGWGDSGDQVRLLSPDHERKDVQVLIDHVAARPEVLKDGPGDPRLGMTGGSYGGAYQLLVAAYDARVDAIAPEIGWSDLLDSLAPNGVIKAGWAQLLFGYGAPSATAEGLDPRYNGVETGSYEQELVEIYLRAVAANAVDDDAAAYLRRRSLVGYADGRRRVAVPTLVMQGSVDTLFDVNEAVRVVEHVRAAGAPARLVVFCGGHVSCPSSYADADDRAHLDRAILTWFARHLRGEDVATGSPVEYRTNEGIWRSVAAWPPPGSATVTVSGQASLLSTPPPTGQGTVIEAGLNRPGDPHAATFEVAAATGGPLEVVGTPTARLSVAGRGGVAHLFVKLVDREAGHVVNVQEAAVRVEDLSATPQTVEVDLPGVAYTLPAGHHLDLQVATTSAMHATARTPAEVTVAVSGEVPVVDRSLPVAVVRSQPPRAAADRPGPSDAAPSSATASVPLPATGGGAGLVGPLLLLPPLLVRRGSAARRRARPPNVR